MQRQTHINDQDVRLLFETLGLGSKEDCKKIFSLDIPSEPPKPAREEYQIRLSDSSEQMNFNIE